MAKNLDIHNCNIQRNLKKHIQHCNRVLWRPNAHTGVIPPPTVQGATERHRAGNTEHWAHGLTTLDRVIQAKDSVIKPRCPEWDKASPSTATTRAAHTFWSRNRRH
jgi:hypothetical protein